ncbi:hypothetical protein [Nocardia sp. NPDC052112]|uniref:hypothetical protein n=1 Tax=Nocardia sp. NPDC052112 TaxID=3155646 RepID=UPI003448CE02
MYETSYQHHGNPEQIEEFTTAVAPSAPPTAEQLTQIYESMRAAGWKTPPYVVACARHNKRPDPAA